MKDKSIESFIETQNPNDQQTPPNLSIQDLVQVVQVIDAAFARGAFRASEAKDVGMIYEKLATFVNFTIESQKTNEEKLEDNK